MLSNYEVIDRLKNNLEVWMYSFQYNWVNERAVANILPCSVFLTIDDVQKINQLQTHPTLTYTIDYLGVYNKTGSKSSKRITSYDSFYTNYEDCKAAYNATILSYELYLKTRAERIQKQITEKYFIK